RRHEVDLHGAIAARDGDRSALAGTTAQQLGNFRETLDPLTVDLKNAIAGLQSCDGRRRAIEHRADHRQLVRTIKARLAQAMDVAEAIDQPIRLELNLALHLLAVAAQTDHGGAARPDLHLLLEILE